MDGDQQITYMEFINFLKRQEIKHNTDKMLPKISNLSVEEAVLMIREKLIAQLTTAKAATNLRRAFQAVDLDGGGTIEKDEIKEVLVRPPRLRRQCTEGSTSRFPVSFNSEVIRIARSDLRTPSNQSIVPSTESLL